QTTGGSIYVFLFLTGFFNFMLHTDPCSQPMDEGSCSLYVLLWYYYPESSECRPFVYSGCGGNNNHFASKQECMDRCVERKEKDLRSSGIQSQRWRLHLHKFGSSTHSGFRNPTLFLLQHPKGVTNLGGSILLMLCRKY
uniref:BPTI/Kunitz inhibitor domain-containing protein n=1 Tax=Callorhinchus milii TaxID=7868 RepID=A0A4W3IIJ5_CALMI